MNIKLSNEQIKEIADQLDCGFHCFLNKLTNELIFVPDMLKHPNMDEEPWASENEALENNFADYYEFEQLESRDSFLIMGQFAEMLEDSNHLKQRLFDALNKSKPFRQFKFIIDNSGEYRQKWFDFKSKKLQEWVISQLDDFSTAS